MFGGSIGLYPICANKDNIKYNIIHLHKCIDINSNLFLIILIHWL